MATNSKTHQPSLSAADREELTKLTNAVALSEKSLTLFAIAPESAPDHPVAQQLKTQLNEFDEPLQFLNFFYSDTSLFNFLGSLNNQAPPESGRRVILAFGLEQLPTPRLKQELEQLNLARERIFEQNLVLVFWLNRERFLDEFRNRAPDFWDWRGKVATFETRHPLLYPYLEWLIAENSYLTMSGVMQVNRQVDIFLDQIYVSLQAERRQQVTTTTAVKHQRATTGRAASQRQSVKLSSRPSSRDRSGEDFDYDFAPEPMMAMEPDLVELETASKTVIEKVDLADVVRGPSACSVILGAPGAGKTTLLKYLALHFAKAKRDDAATVQGGADQETLGDSRLPIYFKIADYAERLEQRPELGLLDYLKQFYRHWEDYFDGGEAADISSLLLAQMGMGQCLILLDGLDEVFDQESRRQIVGRINEFAEQFGHNKLIVTSRIAGYQEVKLASRFLEFTITDMSDDQVSTFLHRWCRAVEQAQKPEATAEQQAKEGDQQAELILSDIQKNEGVKRLTANPLLLTILALIHRNGERLPERRVKLYELAVQTLTADWQLSKKLPNMQKVLLPEGEVVELLAPLAYWMHEEKPSGLVTHREVVQQLAPRLAELRGEAPDSPEIMQAVAEFLRRVRETTGLFVERSPEVYGFMHLTFEEYFAARYIVDNEISRVLQIIQPKIPDPRWEEPILLALSFLNDHFPKRSRILIENLFRGLIKLGYEMKPKREVRCLAAIKLNLLRKEAKLAKNRNKKTLAKPAGYFFLKLVDLFNILTVFANFWIFKYVMALYLKSSYSGKLNLAFQAVQDIDLNLQKRLELLEGLTANKILIDSLNLSPRQKTLSLKKPLSFFFNDIDIQILNQFSSNFSEKIRDLRHSNLLDVIQEYLKVVANNLLLPEEVLGSAQNLFFEISIDDDTSGEARNSADIVESLGLSLPGKHQPLAYKKAGDAYKKKNKYKEAINNYEESRDLYQHLCNEASVAKQWYSIGDCYKEQDEYEQAIECQHQVLIIRQKLHDQPGTALAYYQLGYIYQGWGKYEEAIAHYEQSHDLYKQLDKETDVADLWYWLADCYREWGQYEQALAAEQKDLAIRKKLHDKANIASAYWHLGYIYQAWGKYEEAIAHHEQSRDLYQKLGNEINVADQWGWLATTYRDCGKYERALECCQTCLNLYQELGNESNVASAHCNLGRIYQSWGKYAEAISHHEQSRDLYQKLDKEADVANQWLSLAICYRDCGQYNQALAAGQQDLAIRQKLDSQLWMAISYVHLGRIYQDWGKYAEAIANYEQSRDLYKQLGKESYVADLWGCLASTYRDWDKYEQALECNQEYLTLYQELGHELKVASAYYRLGRTYQDWGKYAEAIANYEQSRDLYQKIDKKPDIADIWYWIGDCHKDQGRYEQAIECQQRCLELRRLEEDQSTVAISIYQLGQIYQGWGKYGEAIAHYEQSRDLYQQLGKEKNVSYRWYNLAECYREWGKYEQALQCEQKDLELCRKLDLQEDIALSFYQQGRIYQAWGKYEEAIRYHEQSRDLDEKLDLQQEVANQLSSLAACHRALKDYTTAIEYYQNSFEKHQALGHIKSAARRLRQLSNTQRLQAKDSAREEAMGLLQQADSNLQQAIQLDTAGDYRENLAYDHIVLALLAAEQLRWLPSGDGSMGDLIAQFEQAATDGFARFAELGQVVDSAEEALDIARAYLEIGPLENLDQAEVLARQSLQTFQEFNRRKLKAAACKLLGEIYLARSDRFGESGGVAVANEFLTESLRLYHELDLSVQATAVERLVRGGS